MVQKKVASLLSFLLILVSTLAGSLTASSVTLATPILPIRPAATASMAEESPATHDAHWGEKDSPMVIEVQALQPGTNVLTGLGVQFSAPVIVSAELMDDQGNSLQIISTLKKRSAVFDISKNPVPIPSAHYRKFYVYLTYIDNQNGKYPEGFHLIAGLLPSSFKGKYLDPYHKRWLPLGFVFNTTHDSPIFDAVLTKVIPASLNISKSLSSPPAGDIAVADNQLITVWDYDVQGEDVRISSNVVYGNLTDAGGNYVATYADLTNARLVDMTTGNILSGPVDGADDANGDYGTAGVDAKFIFNTTFVLPVGVTKVGFKVRIGTDFENNDDLTVAIVSADDVVAYGDMSNTPIVPDGTYPVAGETQTVRVGALLIETLGIPASKNIVVGSQDLLVSTYSFDAGESSEDVLVSSFTILDDVNDIGETDDFNNMDLWADLDSNGTYETKISITEQPHDNAPGVDDKVIFVLNPTLRVAKGSRMGIALIADVNMNATEGGTHILETSATDCAVVTGADTGMVIDASTAGLDINATLTIISGGTLSVTIDARSPQAQILVGNTYNVTLAVFRLWPTEEDQILNRITATDDGDDNTVTTYYLYANRDNSGNLVTPYLVDTANPVNGVAEFGGWGSMVKMPKDTYTKIYIKADMANIDGVSVVNGDTVRVTIEDPSRDIESVGIMSGMAIPGDSGISLDAAENPVYKTKPYVSMAADSPSGQFVPSPATTIAKFKLTADAATDVSLRNEDSNQIVVKINTSINDYSGTSAVRLLDNATGQDFDVTQNVDFGAGNNTATITFDFDLNNFYISAGVTKYFSVVVDTLQFEDMGDCIQAWLDDNDPANFSWGIDGSGNYATAEFTFRGDIYANVLVKQ